MRSSLSGAGRHLAQHHADAEGLHVVREPGGDHAPGGAEAPGEAGREASTHLQGQQGSYPGSQAVASEDQLPALHAEWLDEPGIRCVAGIRESGRSEQQVRVEAHLGSEALSVWQGSPKRAYRGSLRTRADGRARRGRRVTKVVQSAGASRWFACVARRGRACIHCCSSRSDLVDLPQGYMPLCQLAAAAAASQPSWESEESGVFLNTAVLRPSWVYLAVQLASRDGPCLPLVLGSSLLGGHALPGEVLRGT